MRDHPAGRYTRGWEVFAHFLTMAGSSLRRHLAFSLLVGTLVGFSCFYNNLAYSEQGALLDYTKCTLLKQLAPHSLRHYSSLESKVTNQEACNRFEALFGRSLGFLGKQAALRLFIMSSLAFCLLTFFVVRYGTSLKKDKPIRGTKVIDPVKKEQRKRVKEGLCSLLIGQATASVLLAYYLGERLALVPDLAITWLATKWSWLLALLSQDGTTTGFLWYQSFGERGFYDPREVLPHLEGIIGFKLLSLLAVWLILSLAFGAIPFFVFYNKKKQDEGDDLTLADLSIPARDEAKHFLMCGSPGSGKSTAIKELLRQIRERGQKAIIYDCSGEYLEEFYESEDLILNPLDDRSQKWNLWAEVRRQEDYFTMGRSLFPTGGGVKDPFWNEASTCVFADLAEVLSDTASHTMLAELLLHSSLEELHEALMDSPAARFLDSQAAQMPHNLLATMASKLRVFNLLADEGSFSIRKFVSNSDSNWLFLTSRQDQHETLKPLITLWCDLAATEILSIPPNNPPRIWLILDEVPSLQKLPALPPLLERGRKHGVACVLGLQSLAQLRSIWGRDEAAALMAQPQNWLVLRTVEAEAARWLEASLGSTEKKEVLESLSMGANSQRDGASIHQQIHNRPIVLATEIMNLPDLCGYFSSPGRPVQQVKLTLPDRHVVAETACGDKFVVNEETVS